MDEETLFVRMQDELRAYNDPVDRRGLVPPAWTKDEALFLRFRAWQARNLREKTRAIAEQLDAGR
jgi:hypothetical protein